MLSAQYGLCAGWILYRGDLLHVDLYEVSKRYANTYSFVDKTTNVWSFLA